MSSQANADSQGSDSLSNRYNFLLRGLLLIVVTGVVMSLGNVNIGAIGQGLGYALAGVCVFITYRILGFVDLTVDGAFPIGGAICAVLIAGGASPEAALLAAFVFGALTGLATALVDILFKIEGLLASIIVITATYTVTLRIMGGRSNIPLLGQETLISRHSRSFRGWLVEQFGDELKRQSTNLLEIMLFGGIVIVVLVILYWLMRSELGLAVRATGKNAQMVRATGINHNVMIVLGLMVANGLAGLSGSLVVQQFGFADVSLGFGLIIRGLAAVIIGEVLLRPKSTGQLLVAAVAGMLVFDISRAWIFSSLDLPTTDIQFVSALVVLAALGTPRLYERYKAYRQRFANTR
ncbi:MAG: ABC transporter permease [Chloroflexi bacterium]|nr:ABC transporter permease [Chloroflexota bacterium]MCY4247102.1 ABC transporter permease [Chloroflexota bacterium]